MFETLRLRLPGADVIRDAPMSRYTSMRVGGAADYLLNASSEEEARAAMAVAREMSLPVSVMGGGTNLIVRDGGIRGLVVRFAERFIGMEFVGEKVKALSGVTLAALSRACAEKGLAGLEFASGIPGTLGGGLCMNAGAYGGEMSMVVKSVRAMDGAGETVTLDAEACAFGYRTSVIKESGYVALSAELALERGDAAAIRARMEELGLKRRSRQPLTMPSAGSVFKRPEGDFAGRLIEAAGMKGAKVGGAQVSEMHANFIVNTGTATASDVLELMALVRMRVLENAGVALQSELCVVGSDEHG